MMIERSKNSLRQHEEQGIWIDDTTIATELLLADDSILLSDTPNSVLTQLELVQVYIDGSGAKLKLRESSFLSF